MTAVDTEAVRGAVQDLREAGRSVIKSKDIAAELDLDEGGGTLASIGHSLNTLAEEGEVEIASQAGAGNTYRIPQVVTDGGSDHDLDALADAIQRVLAADVGTDTRWSAGPYTAHERVLSRSGATIREVVVEYDGAQSWVVLPEGLAEVVIKAIRDREHEREILTDGGTQGAIDHEFDEGRREFDDEVERELGDVQTSPMSGGVAIDLVTRQPLFVRQVVAEDLVEYYDEEGFNLLTYKTHPYLPVRKTDRVFECVFVSGSPEGAHNPGDTYDFPEGRLMHYPVEQAWGGDDR